MRFIVSCILILTPLISRAQKNEIDTYFSALRNKQPVNSFSFKSKNESQYMKPLSGYLEDTVSAIRSEAYYLVSKLGEHTQQKSLRKDVVKFLLQGWRDPDSGIKGQVEN